MRFDGCSLWRLNVGTAKRIPQRILHEIRGEILLYLLGIGDDSRVDLHGFYVSQHGYALCLEDSEHTEDDRSER